MRRSRLFLRRLNLTLANSLKSLMRRLNAAVAAAVCSGSRNRLILLVRRFCGAGVSVSPHTPHSGRAPLRGAPPRLRERKGERRARLADPPIELAAVEPE